MFTDFEAGIHYPQARTQSGVNQRRAPQIANPVRQSKEFDARGDFIRLWVPELSHLPDAHIHAPWDAPKSALAAAGIVFGQTYPMRIVDHVAAAREAREKMTATLKQASKPMAQDHTVPDQHPILSGRQDPLPVNAVGRAARRRTGSTQQLSLDLFAPAQAAQLGRSS